MINLKMKKTYIYIFVLIMALLAGCDKNVSDSICKQDSDLAIHIGGVLTDGNRLVVTQTRATGDSEPVRAETVPWMQGALRHGLDITYSNLSNGSHDTENEAVAILRWKGTSDPTTDRGDYTFKYKGTEDDAEWYDNGPHYFEGEYVPDLIRDGNGKTMNIADLTTNQANDADYTYNIDSEGNETTSGSIGNYTLLSHYVGMPPNWTHSATVDQILLPFKHRLARVIVYILIDDQLLALDGSPAVIEGYKGTAHTDLKDDPSTTSLRFANVKVLEHVEEIPAANANKTSSLVPKWKEARRVIPHFCDEFDKSYRNEPDADHPDRRELAVASSEAQKYIDVANDAFIVYTNKRDEKKIHPRESGWFAAHKDFVDKGASSAYTQQKYHRVPIYDVIVRPTYQDVDDVMYDEECYYNDDKTPNTTKIKEYAKEKNQIEFEMTLNNGLIYTKVFEFDLNANQQTVVYISIDRESIDYDQSASEPWIHNNATDGYYGVNNDLGHNMSIAGSSWQRAVTYSASEPNLDVTDGNYYDDGRVDDGDLGQYFSDTNQWIEEFAKANMGGERQGHYFVLDKNITIDATKLPDNFVFSGHLDGRGHTITVENLGTTWYEANYVHEIVTPEVLYTQDEIDAAIAIVEAADYVQGSNSTAEEVAQKSAGDIKTPAVWGDVNHPIEHTSGSSLFAGLNGTYNGAVGQYNLHKESGDKVIPVKGYRAELYNTTVSGGTFFPAGAVFCGKDLNLSGATVTGYIYNCFDADHVAPNNPLTNVVPIPAY